MACPPASRIRPAGRLPDEQSSGGIEAESGAPSPEPRSGVSSGSALGVFTPAHHQEAAATDDDHGCNDRGDNADDEAGVGAVIVVSAD